MKKKVWITALAVAMILAATLAFSACVKSNASDAVANGSFENVDSDTNIVGWQKSADSSFAFAKNVNDGSDEYDPHLGARYASIKLTSGTKAYDYLFQSVKLKKNVTYRLSAYMKVDSITPTKKIGARIGFKEDADFEGLNVVEADKEWKEYEYYFVSATDKEMTITVGLGSATAAVYGTVFFDNVSIESVDEVPATYEGTVGMLKFGDEYSLSDGPSVTFVVLLTLLSLCVAFGLYMLLRKSMCEKSPLALLSPVADGDGAAGEGAHSTARVASPWLKALVSPFAMFLYVILGAFLLRFLFCVLTYGMTNNVSHMSDIIELINNSSLLSLYASDALTINEPQGLVYLTSLLGVIAKALNIESGSLGMAILLRLPDVIADVVICYLIYNFTARNAGEKQAAIYSGLYAALPIFFFFGGFYAGGQCVAMALLLAAVFFIADKKYIASGITYTFALMFSHYALLLLPIVAGFQIYGAVQDKEKRVPIIVTMILSFVVFYALTIPLCWSQFKSGKVLFAFEKMYAYFKTSQPLLSADSFGIYALFGAVNKSRSVLLEVGNWLFVITMAACALAAFFVKGNRADLVLCSSAVVILYALFGAQSNPVILPIGLVLLLAALCMVGDSRLFAVFTGLTTLSFLNMAQIASRSGFISDSAGSKYLMFAGNDAFLIIMSLFGVALAAYLLYVVIDICVYDSTRDIQPLDRGFKGEMKHLFGFSWLRRKKAK